MTLGSSEGAFIYYDRAPGSFSGIARLFSPPFGQSGVQCEIEFYYYKSDSNVASFAVYIVNEDSNAEKLWLTTGTSSNSGWTKTAIGIYRRTNGFKIYFEGIQIVSQGYTQLAIDDVNFKSCQTQSTISCANSNVFTCFNGQCISTDAVYININF